LDEAAQRATSTRELRLLQRCILIRRTRSDVESETHCASRHLRFPQRATPQPIAYDPDRGAPGSHREVLSAIAALRLDALGMRGAPLLRYVLLKRLSSSQPALSSTVRGMIAFHRDYLAALGDGLLLRPRDRLFDQSSDLRQLSLSRLLLRPVPPSDDIDALHAAAAADLSRLHRIAHELCRVGATDDKLDRLRALSCDTLRGEKLLIFTEFRETAVYLWRNLRDIGGVAMIHGERAYLGRAPASRSLIVRRFSPRANGVDHVHPREVVRVLIATDVLAEGLNLQDCANVLSYDLPWNPVRMIQRIGRIDRLGSAHRVVTPYNFVPDRDLDQYLDLLNRLRRKLTAIDIAIGSDTPVLADATRSVNDRSPLGSAAREERLRRWLRAAYAKPAGPATLQRAEPQPPDTLLPVTVVHSCDARGESVFVFAAARGCETVHATTVQAMRYSCGRASIVDPADIIDHHLLHQLDAAAIEQNVDSREISPRMRTLVAAALRISLNALSEQSQCQVRTRSRSPYDLLARRLMAAFASLSGGGSPAEAAGTERILDRLAAPQPVHIELRLQEIARDPPSVFADLLSVLESALVWAPFPSQSSPVDRNPAAQLVPLALIVVTGRGDRPG
jgi:hypothetical protein